MGGDVTMGDADLIRLMREASGCSMTDCKASLELARKELDGDIVVALLMRNAATLAVKIGSRDPDVSDAEARRRWDEAHARGRREAVVERGGAWTELDLISARSAKGATSL